MDNLKNPHIGSASSEPQQKLLSAQKTEQWYMNNVDYYSSITNVPSSVKAEMKVLYGLALGKHDERDYTYVINPLGEEQKKRKELQGDPAKLRNYDIISPIVNRIIGDFIARRVDFKIAATNTKVEERRAKFIQEQVKQNLLIEFQNELANQGLDTGFNGQPSPMEEIMAKAKEVPDTMTVNGQRAYEYIKNYNEVDRKYRLMLFDYITVGRFFSYRDVFQEDTVYEAVSPLDIEYIASPGVEFIEDASAVRVTYWMNLSEVLDKFYNDLTPAEIDYLSSKYSGTIGVKAGFEVAASDVDVDWKSSAKDELFRNLFGSRQGTTNHLIDVTHVVWKGMVKKGKLTTWSAFGDVSEPIEVDEDFKPRPGEEVEWVWVNQVYEAYRIADRIYKRMRPLPIQRGTINNPSKCKLPYNGRIFGPRGSLGNTPVKKGRAHQELYNILKYRMERTIAKNKDHLILFPIGLVPETEDMDMFSMMYYGDYHGWLFFDESDPKKLQAMNAIKVLDASLREYIKFIHDLCAAIREEYYEIVGIPRQKLADIKANDNVGNTQAAIAQGALMLEDMLLSFEEAIQRDITALLDYSKYAWINGKKKQIINARGELTMIDIDMDEHTMAEYTLFPMMGRLEQQNLDRLKDLSQAFAQNSATPTMIGQILKSNNFDELMGKLQAMEDKITQSQQGAAQQQQQLEMAKLEDKEADRKVKMYDTDVRSQTDIEVALIQAEQSMRSLIVSGQQAGTDVAEYEKTLASIQTQREANQIKREDIAQKREAKQVDLAIAKENKQKHEVKK